MKVYEALAQSLVDREVEVLFGLAGDANLLMIDTFVRVHAGTYVAGANEAGVVLMANGYATVSGRVGVATVTHGPAVTNTLTAIIEGVRNHTPMVLIAGATPREDRENLQFADQSSIFWGTGAGFEDVRSERTVLLDLDIAFRRARLERRPIVVNMPVEIQELEIDYRSPAPTVQDANAVVPGADALDDAAALLAASQRTVVLAGRGATSVPSRQALLALAGGLGAPVATTLKARELFASEPQDLGIFGTLGHDTGLQLIAEADCVIAFGASLNKWTTANGGLLDGKRVIQVDTDASAIGRFRPVHLGLVGDAAATAEALRDRLGTIGFTPRAFGDRSAVRLAEIIDHHAFEDRTNDITVDLRAALRTLEDAMPSDKALATDGGQFLFDSLKMLSVDHPSKFVLGVNFGSIGLGMGNAIGVAYGTGAPVLMISGDGGFMLGGITEFNTAVRHGVDLVVAVFDNGCYGPEYVHFKHEELSPEISQFDWPDFADVARALGGEALSVHDARTLAQVPDAIKTRTKPLLLHFRIDPDLTASEREQRR